MARHVAFLRAINVGGHVVAMKDLRGLFETCGFSKVETFIASGNVIFDSRSAAQAAEKKVEACLRKVLGYEVATFIRSASEVGAIAAAKPFRASELEVAKTYCVGFMAEPLSARQKKLLMDLRTEHDDFRVSGREVFWLSRKGQGESEFSNASLERTLGIRSTLRGMNTIVRLWAKHFPEE
jgi:uncharacterized protein (DUF1697 family)